MLAVAAIAVAVAQLAAGLALDTAPARVRFAHGARVLDQARALGGAPYVLLLGSSRFWQLDADTAAVALRETVGGDGPGLLKGAMPAGDPIVADYLIERLLAEGSHPRLIALEISPEIIANPSRWVAEHAVRFFTWRDVAVWTPEIVRAGKTGAERGNAVRPPRDAEVAPSLPPRRWGRPRARAPAGALPRRWHPRRARRRSRVELGPRALHA